MPSTSFPRGGSETGDPIAAYAKHRSTAPTVAHRARGWAKKPGIEPEDYVLFLPRALLFVPRWTLRAVFWPLRQGLTVVERYAVIEHVRDVLYNDARTAGILPAASYQSGFGFSFGANLFHSDLFGHGESLALAARYGGLFVQGYQLSFDADRLAGSNLWIESRLRYEKKPAILFYGIGDPPAGTATEHDLDPRAKSVATRFRQERLLGLLRGGVAIGHRGELIKVGVSVGYNHRTFGPEDHGFVEPSLETVYATSKLTGFGATLNLVEVAANLILDFRDSVGKTASGFFFEAFGGTVLPFDDYQYQHYGAELSLFFDLYRKSRVLMFRVALEGVAGEYDEIPFVELPRLGGAKRLRGYVNDRFRDKLAVLGTVQYRYPVHQLVSVELFAEIGKVGPTYQRVFGESERWRLAGGGNLVFHTDSGVVFRFGFGYGDGPVVFFSTGALHALEDRSRQL